MVQSDFPGGARSRSALSSLDNPIVVFLCLSLTGVSNKSHWIGPRIVSSCYQWSLRRSQEFVLQSEFNWHDFCTALKMTFQFAVCNLVSEKLLKIHWRTIVLWQCVYSAYSTTEKRDMSFISVCKLWSRTECCTCGTSTYSCQNRSLKTVVRCLDFSSRLRPHFFCIKQHTYLLLLTFYLSTTNITQASLMCLV